MQGIGQQCALVAAAGVFLAKILQSQTAQPVAGQAQQRVQLDLPVEQRRAGDHVAPRNARGHHEGIACATRLVFLEIVRFVHRQDFKRQIRLAHQPTQAFIVRHHPIAAIQRGDAVLAYHAHHGIWIDGMDLALPVDAQRGWAEDQHPALACRQARRHHGLAALAKAHVIAQARATLAGQVTHAGVLVVAQACALSDLDQLRLMHLDSGALIQMR